MCNAILNVAGNQDRFKPRRASYLQGSYLPVADAVLPWVQAGEEPLTPCIVMLHEFQDSYWKARVSLLAHAPYLPMLDLPGLGASR